MNDELIWTQRHLVYTDRDGDEYAVIEWTFEPLRDQPHSRYYNSADGKIPHPLIDHSRDGRTLLVGGDLLLTLKE